MVSTTGFREGTVEGRPSCTFESSLRHTAWWSDFPGINGFRITVSGQHTISKVNLEHQFSDMSGTHRLGWRKRLLVSNRYPTPASSHKVPRGGWGVGLTSPRSLSSPPATVTLMHHFFSLYSVWMLMNEVLSALNPMGKINSTLRNMDGWLQAKSTLCYAWKVFPCYIPLMFCYFILFYFIALCSTLLKFQSSRVSEF